MLRGNLTALCNCLRRGSTERCANLCSLRSDDRTRGNGTKLGHVKFRLDIRKEFFTMRMVKHWNRLTSEEVDAPRLSAFKRHLDNVLINMV